ncbi:Fur family transcriptional regulator [Caviibacter abscessus]|uniref:Fur family transcriptional regulator n=1 Tax=Caviibacter abscessus TaxID=1766719 RepID=UPI000839700D|nr:Fur family transcriptional regulator [Caviibacter abscessus]
MKNISDKLKKNNIKPSLQRIQIFQYLLQAKNHPSVDMIYSDLHNQIPTLSKTTVYNTLKIFTQKKLVNEIVEGKENRYDAISEPHGHFKCMKCQDIYDFEYDFELKELKDFDIELIQFYVKGICKNCKK